MPAQFAAQQLMRYGVHARRALPELIDALSSGDYDLRACALRSIALIGPVARSGAGAAVRRALEDESTEVRCAAVETVAAIGIRDPEVISEVLGLLSSDEDPVRETVVSSLEELGVDPDRAAPPVEKLLDDP